jgi:protein-disulfide isomerase
MLNSLAKSWWGKLFLLISFLILTLFAAFVFYLVNQVKEIRKGQANQVDIGSVTSGKKYDIPIGSNYWIGAAAPKITIIEFSDFACPYCKNSFPNIREIGVKYKDKVKIIFKDLPLHDESPLLAMGGRCAGEQGLFWLMHDKLFVNQGISTTAQVESLANQIGADTDRFDSCLLNSKYLKEIENDYNTAQELGITGTPTWFINGYRVNGDIPHDEFIKLIDGMLK